MKNNIVIVICSLLIGIFTQRFILNDNKLDNSNLSSIDNELNQIKNLPSEQRNEKGIQLLQKMIKLLMIDVTLRIQDKNTLSDVNSNNLNWDKERQMKTPSVVKLDSVNTSVATLNSDQSDMNFKKTTISQTSNDKIKSMLETIVSESQIISFLDKTIIEDFQKQNFNMAVTSKLYNEFVGHYEGELDSNPIENELSKMTVDFFSEIQNEKFIADSKIEIFKGGKLQLSYRGTGNTKDFKSFDDSQSSMIFYVGNRDEIFHFFKAPKLDILFGNLYRINKNNEWKRTATFKLHR